jgi:aminoglycoside phosphotransferase (APT) family kinase protein
MSRSNWLARRDDHSGPGVTDSFWSYAALAGWIGQNLLPDWSGVEVEAAVRTSAGFSYETWILDIVEPNSPRSERMVMRREPEVGPIEPYDISTEARMFTALESTDLPTPRLLGHCEDHEVVGRPFILVEFVAGDVPDYRTVTASPDWQDPTRRSEMAAEFAQTLARIQGLDAGRLARAAQLEQPSSERARLHRAIDHHVDVIARRTPHGWPPHPIFNDAAAWLRRNAPDGPPEDMVMVHGDYKLGNLIWRDRQVVAVIDWEGAEIGDPLQDLGYACHPIMREADPSLIAMLAPLDEMVAAFENASGRTVNLERLHYYVIYALFFHTFTVVMGLISVVEPSGDVRIASMYSKLNQVTRHLTDQIAAYERGMGVL